MLLDDVMHLSATTTPNISRINAIIACVRLAGGTVGKERAPNWLKCGSWAVHAMQD